MTDIISYVHTSIQQQLNFFLQNKYKHLNIYYKVLLSTILASFTAKIFNKTDSIYENIWKILIYIKKLLVYRRTHTISLISKKIWTKYGRYKNIISDEKLGLLYYISKRLHKFKDLYDLVQDYRITTDYSYGQENDKLDTYYTISQNKKVEIFRNKYDYITAHIEEYEDNTNDGNKNIMQKMITDTLILESNMSLEKINVFIKDAKKERQDNINNDPNRYIYTYLGEDEDKNPMFEEELFVPYCKFNKLVGDIPKKIEHSFDFFISKKGKDWYAERNLPYQTTVLLYGQPGTGKSCIASAVATKYNLHIVRIKLSLIKTNYQFIKAFKNRVFNEKTLDYEHILYLFDELDTENNNILKKRHIKGERTTILSNYFTKQPTDNDTSNTSNTSNTLDNIDNVDIINTQSTSLNKIVKKYNIKDNELEELKKMLIMGPTQTISDALTLGTILEELNGINQMYGRKMFIISNHPEHLDPAILRPGRIDLQYELQHLTYCEIVELINIFFPDSEYTTYEKETLQTKKITAAKLTNLCKISKTKDKVMSRIYKMERM
jgi:hypothetical protein